MPIRFRCKCGKGFKVASKFAGKRVKCPACGVAMLVPVPNVPPEPESPRPEGELELEMDAAPSPPSDTSAAPEGELSMEDLRPTDRAKVAQPSAEAADTGTLEPEGLVEAIPLDSEAPAAQEAEKACPKCGAPAPGNSVICTECGGRFIVEEDEASAFPVPTTNKNPMKLLVLGAVGVIVLAGIILGLMMLLKKPAEQAGPGSSTGDAAVRAGSEQVKKLAPPEPEPPVVPVWEGFADPALRTRDKLLALGEKLTAFKERSSQFPSDLAELGMSDTAGIVYLGREVASLERFRPLAHATEADAVGRISVLFSDGTVRAVESKDLDSVLLSHHPAGLMTKPDAALLSQLGPQLRVTNTRFTELEVSLGDRVLGAVKKGKSQTFALAEGSHNLVFSARGKQSEKIGFTCNAGALYEYTFHRHQDLPIIPAYEYRNALAQANDQRYKIDKNGERVSGLSGQGEVVHFTSADVRNAVSRNYRAINGWIERQHLKIEGLQGRAILVSPYGRLEEGVVRYASGQEISYRRTALGTLAMRERPNIEVASLARFPEEPKWGEEEFMEPEFDPLDSPYGDPYGDPYANPYQEQYGRSQTVPRGRSLRVPAARSRRATSSSRRQRPTPRRPGRMPARDAAMMQEMMDMGMGMEAKPLGIEIPDMLYVPGPDCEALAARLRQSASGITPLLVRQIDSILAQQTPGDDDGRRRARPRARRRTPRARQPIRPEISGWDEYSSHDPEMEYEGQRQARPLGYSEPLPDESVTDLIATLAVHGDSSALLMLSRLAQEMNTQSPGYGELLIALARCGGGQALLQIKSAADQAPQQAAIALAMVDTAAARKALREVVGKWSALDVTRTVAAWPDVAGIHARAVLMKTLIATRPTLLEGIPALNALMELDPYTLESILLAQLLEKPEVVEEGLSEEMEEEEFDDGYDEAQDEEAREYERQMLMMTGEQVVDVPPAWQILARLKNTQALEHFVSLLKGDDVEEKRDAMGAIAQAHDESFAQTAAALLKDTDRATRKHAVSMLVAMGTAEAINALNEAMSDELLFASIPNAASDLADKSGHDTTVALLARMLDISVDAAFALPEIEDEEQEAWGRRPIRTGRGRPGRDSMDDMDGMPVPVSDVATPEVIVDALIKLRASSEPVRTAIEKAHASDNPDTRAVAYKAMAALPLSDASGPVRGSMIRGIFKLVTVARSGGVARTTRASAANVSASSLAAAKDSDPGVRAAGIAMMKSRSADEAAPVLEAGLADTSPETRAVVMETAATVEGDSLRITQILASGLNDSDPQVIAAAARAAAQRKQSGLGQALVAALNKPAENNSDETSQTLWDLIQASGALGERATVQSLALLLGHTQPEIREAAARALGSIGDDNAVYALRTMLKDQDQAVKAASILALSRLSSPDAISVSLEALGSKDLPQGIRAELLTRLVAECANPGAYADWLDRSGQLDETSLRILVAIAYQQRPELRNGFLHLAKKYLAEGEAPVRPHAARMLACYRNDPEARKILLDAFMHNAAGIGEPVARMLRQIDDREMLPMLRKLHRSIVSANQEGREGRSQALQGIGEQESRLLLLAIIDAVSNFKGNDAAQMLWEIASKESRPDVVAKVLEALPQTESSLTIGYLGKAANRIDLFGVQVANGLSEAGRLRPQEARFVLSKIARSHDSRAAAVAADALEDLAEISPSKTR